MEPSIAEGIRLFNTQKFFEAHEALETVWLKAQAEEKSFLHGLIQIAAAFHHFTRGNLTGFQSLLAKGLSKLEGCREARGGICLEEFLKQLQPWRQFTEQSVKRQHHGNLKNVRPEVPPPFPRITAIPSG
jgi:hypothetical protein